MIICGAFIIFKNAEKDRAIKESLRFTPPSFDEFKPTFTKDEAPSKPDNSLKIKIRPTDEFYQQLKDNNYKVKDTIKEIDPQKPPVKVEVEIRF